jgi:hypothetical protein
MRYFTKNKLPIMYFSRTDHIRVKLAKHFQIYAFNSYSLCAPHINFDETGMNFKQ